VSIVAGEVAQKRYPEDHMNEFERAKRKGTKFGRPSALDASQRRKVADRYAAGETIANLAIAFPQKEVPQISKPFCTTAGKV
jgi:hypothetical protein